MKKLSLAILGAMAMFTACHSPENVVPTAERQGLTSITAIYTSGPFVDKEMAVLPITDETTDHYVIEVPYYYPEDTDNETEQYMSKVRLKAIIDNNCFIEPALGIVNLNEENWYTFTNVKGEQRRFCITGKRVKSNKCELLAFSINEPEIAGIVNKATKEVSLISGDNLSACTATAQVSPHATISPDPSEVLNYDDPVVFTVTADNGVDKAEYTVKKTVPEKIPYGFNPSSFEELFSLDPVAHLNLPPYTTEIGPTLAFCNNKLVICLGNGEAPTYHNALSGSVEGNINVGSVKPASVTSDNAEHMLLMEKANGGETIKLYRTNTIKDAPVEFYSFTNPTTFPVGAKVKINGNLDGDALIVMPTEGIDGVSQASQVVIVQVVGGAVAGEQVVDLAAIASWGSAPVNTAAIAAVSPNPADGLFHAQYSESFFDWIKADGSLGCHMGADTTGWGKNPNCIDAKQFNNASYCALFVVSHFPAWGMGPELYLMDVTDKDNLTGDNVWDTPALVYANDGIAYYQAADYSIASGDVLIATSANGYKMTVYYYDHNSAAIGAYAVDCIAQ